MKKEKFVDKANLPENMVSAVIIGEKYYKDIGFELIKRKIRPIVIPNNFKIDSRIEGHADMSVFYCGQGKAIVYGHINHIVKILTREGITVTKSVNEQSGEYPGDIGLNACFVGKRVIHNFKWSDPAVKEYISVNNIISLNVNQGYSKCSVCVLDENTIITSDPGINKKAFENGIKSLLIAPGFIDLPGYNSGFIGGCSGKLSKNIIAFTGRFINHPDREKIENFINYAGIDIVYLTNRNCFDIGSIIPVKEFC